MTNSQKTPIESAMYFPDALTMIARRFAANPKQEFSRLAVGVLLLLLSLPALALFIALMTRSGRDWQVLETHLLLYVGSHLACGAMVFGAIWLRLSRKRDRAASLMVVGCGIVSSSVFGTVMLFGLI